jgi:hypothetical protein
MTKHVVSTLASHTDYADWVTHAGLRSIQKKVTVKGGAGIALQGGGQIVDTPYGVRTEVSDEDAAFLLANDHFKEHMKNGFVKIVNRPVDPDDAAKSMATDDGSRPKNAGDVEDYKKRNAAKTEPGTPPLQAVTNKGR